MLRRFINWIISLRKKPETQNQPTIDVVVASENGQKFDTDFKFSDLSHHKFTIKDKRNVFQKDLFDATKYPSKLLINKTSQGLTMVDPTHLIRKKLCEENNILYGGYHFYMTNRDWKQQMIFYIETHGSFVIPPVIDYETTSGQEESDLMKHKSELLLALRFLKKETGKTPIIYLNYSASKRLQFAPEFGEYYAWFAHYNSFMGPIPAPWTEKTCFAWQFTESGQFKEMPNPAGYDLNVYYAKSGVLND